jgi:hypothetical protein
MRSVLAILLSLFAALPAAGQTQLAQQCAAFGEAQYRKLSPSIDRITALDFPPPALERVEAKAGSQAVNGALTMRGKLTFRNGPPFETHFVCLLDAQRRPLFFYALPALATRGAPTPVTRGGTPAPAPPTADTPTLPLGQAPLSAPEPARPALPASAVRLRGLVRDVGGRLQLLPCDGAPLTLEDRTPEQELTRELRELTTGKEGRPMFVELYGSREVGLGAGIAGLELRRASVETAGCRERFDHREWIATGMGQRLARRVDVARDGSFEIHSLLPGDYLVAAVATDSGFDLQDPADIEALVRIATPVSLTDTQRGSVSLTITRLR